MQKDAKKALGAAKKYTDYAIEHSGGGGTKDYEQLENLPTINSVELKGNRDLAPLVNGKVPAENLPSYVDDVIEGYLYEGHFYEDAQHTTEITGEAGKIYVDLTASVSYRWSGSAFVRVDDVDVTGKADKVTGATNGHLAGLDSNGNLTDSGIGSDIFPSGASSSDKLAKVSDIPSVTGKADKVSGATNGNFAGLDANGNLMDSGHKHSDYLTQHQDITGKADKVTGATSGHLASLDSNGNIGDSGKSVSDFALSANLGTAASKNVPVSGDAGITEVVMGDDSRLSDPRTPTSHTHTLSQITNAGTAASKNSTNAVSSGSEDLVESGAVYTAINTAIGNAVDNLLADSY